MVYTASARGEQSILTQKPLGENLSKAKEGLEAWLAENPIPVENAPEKPTTEKTPEILTQKQSDYLRIKAVLEFLCATFPKCFVPYKSKEPIRALAIGIRKTLLDAVGDKLPEGMVRRDIREALRVYCSFPKYNVARNQVGNPRINLEGEVVGEVTEEEVRRFFEVRKANQLAQKLEKKRVNSKEEVIPDNQKARIEVSSLKVTLPLKPEVVRRDILPSGPGSAKMKVDWEIALTASSGQKEPVYRVAFSVKNYRKALKTIDQCEAEGQECVALLQGKLKSGFSIEEAGLSVQVKTPKEG